MKKNEYIFDMSVDCSAEIINDRVRVGDWGADAVIEEKNDGISRLTLFG